MKQFYLLSILPITFLLACQESRLNKQFDSYNELDNELDNKINNRLREELEEVCLNRTCKGITNDMISEKNNKIYHVGISNINVYIKNKCGCCKSADLHCHCGDDSSVEFIFNVTLSNPSESTYQLVNGAIWVGTDIDDIPRFESGEADPEDFPYKCEVTNSNQCTAIIPLDCLCDDNYRNLNNSGNISCVCGLVIFYSININFIQRYKNNSKILRTAWGDGQYLGDELSDGTYDEIKVRCNEQCNCTKPPTHAPTRVNTTLTETFFKKEIINENIP
jgi:hypothetical protein